MNRELIAKELVEVAKLLTAVELERSHKASRTARRWVYRWDKAGKIIKKHSDILEDADYSERDDIAKRAGRELSKYLDKVANKIDVVEDDDGEGIDEYAVGTLEDIISGLKYVDDVKEFNSYVEDMYNWGDEHSVWIGLGM